MRRSRPRLGQFLSCAFVLSMFNSIPACAQAGDAFATQEIGPPPTAHSEWYLRNLDGDSFCVRPLEEPERDPFSDELILEPPRTVAGAGDRFSEYDTRDSWDFGVADTPQNLADDLGGARFDTSWSSAGTHAIETSSAVGQRHPHRDAIPWSAMPKQAPLPSTSDVNYYVRKAGRELKKLWAAERYPKLPPIVVNFSYPRAPKLLLYEQATNQLSWVSGNRPSLESRQQAANLICQALANARIPDGVRFDATFYFDVPAPGRVQRVDPRYANNRQPRAFSWRSCCAGYYARRDWHYDLEEKGPSCSAAASDPYILALQQSARDLWFGQQNVATGVTRVFLNVNKAGVISNAQIIGNRRGRNDAIVLETVAQLRPARKVVWSWPALSFDCEFVFECEIADSKGYHINVHEPECLFRGRS